MEAGENNHEVVVCLPSVAVARLPRRKEARIRDSFLVGYEVDSLDVAQVGVGRVGKQVRVDSGVA